MHDREEVVWVLIQFRPLITGIDVLVGQRVKVELLLQPCPFGRTGALNIDPSKAVVAYLFDVKTFRFGRRD